ncbi:hypothetical protein BDB01DRAFT_794488 [Pilobolus umbonatus]|nr:hypothetical protein BDB01DRAFT_794488 [Pilobolus umbonatus]
MNRKRIPQWSIRTNAKSAQGLHSAWVKLYDNVCMRVKNTEKRCTRPKRYNTALWKEIFDNFK